MPRDGRLAGLYRHAGQSEIALLIDSRSLSSVSQGITTEITGEGRLGGPAKRSYPGRAPAVADPYHLKS